VSNILILAPQPISAIVVSRGSGAANLLTADPKEVWADTAVGTAANIDIDLGSVVALDTVFLGTIIPPVAGATWTITGGAASYTTTVLKASGALRVPDAAGQFPDASHGFWQGASASVRYLRLAVTQPAGQALLSAGVIMVGAAFRPSFNKEWGSGRRVIDTAAVESLVSGGFAVGDGARKAAYSWTLGDLTEAEVEALHAIALDRGESRPVLVVEDPDQTAGLRRRIHYGLLRSLRAYERRDPRRWRWDFTVEEWI
jgi:hypothetical protein